MKILKTEDLKKYYGNKENEVHALNGVNFYVEEGEFVSIVGTSGSGKSTLLKSLNRMNDLVEGCRITGDIRLDGEDIYGDIDVNCTFSSLVSEKRDELFDELNKLLFN